MIKLEQVSLIIYVCASTAGVLIIKNFLNTISYRNVYDFLIQLINVNLIIGVALYTLGFLTWLYVLSKMSLNTAYPVAVTLSFLAILLLSTLILKEKLSLNIVAGTVICLIGIIIILR